MVLSYHPFSRAAGVVWMLEEVGCDRKVPTLVDGEVVVTEAAAIGSYLADRYAPSTLAPALDDPHRGPYLRWSFYAPSVIEPGCLAKARQWDFSPSQAGWGTYDEMCDTIEAAIGEGPYVLGERFSMADVVFGGTVRFMLRFQMLPARPAFTAYARRLEERAASRRADAINARYARELGLAP